MNMIAYLQSLTHNIFAVFANFRFNDFLDILLVAVLIYNAIKLIRETRTMQLIKGLAVLLLVYGLVSVLKMEASGYLFNALFRDVFLVLIVVFQPEIRHVIESMGRSRFRGIGTLHARSAKIRYNEETAETIEAFYIKLVAVPECVFHFLICSAVEVLAGLLINIEVCCFLDIFPQIIELSIQLLPLR